MKSKALRNKKGVILLSGGLDSAATLYLAKEKGYHLSALIFDYGQRHRKEIEYAKKLTLLNRLRYYLLKINLNWTSSSLTKKRIALPVDGDLEREGVPSTYVSARNIIFLGYAFSLAESIGAKTVFMGAHTQDYSGYPDCRPEFLKAFEKAANSGLAKKGIRIIAPLINKSKKEILKEALRLGVPLEYTWSCYAGKKRPCLECDSCRFREKAFKELGINDPLIKCRQG